MHQLTDKQQQALSRIDAVREMQTKRLLAEYPDCTPSQWVNIETLIRIHCQDRRVIAALVKKGYLEERPTDGWGPEVKRRSSNRAGDSTMTLRDRCRRETDRISKQGMAAARKKNGCPYCGCRTEDCEHICDSCGKTCGTGTCGRCGKCEFCCAYYADFCPIRDADEYK